MIKLLSFVSPVHVHDCESCKYHGSFKIGRGKTAMLVDVYTCNDSEQTIIARFGVAGEYSSMTADQASGLDSELWTAVMEVIAMKGKPTVWTKELVRERLERNDKWVQAAVVSIFNGQTESEKAVGATHEDNGIGFNGVDAEFLSSLATQIIKRGFLTVGQLPYARKKILKYSKQLADIANQAA